MTATIAKRHKSTRAAAPPNGLGLRVALLTRISTDEVNQPYSLEAQATGLEAFVASQPGMRITHRFVDQASGATLDRPGLQQALELAQAGAFDVLLVYRIDRLTRSIVGLMTIVEQLEAAGVALKSATEPIDTQGPVGRMLLQLLGIFAEFERSLLIDRITAGFERKAARGEWLTGRRPYGYHLDSSAKTLTVHDDEAAVVQAIFAKYVDERLGATAIANWLNDTGRRTRYDNFWTGQAILRLLRNPVYIGQIRHGDTIHDGKHDAILDQRLFDQAQALLDERAAESATEQPTESEYLLSGLTRCTSCGGAFIGAGARGRSDYYRYYTCRSRQTKGARACTAQRLPAEDLEDRVIAALLATYDNLDLFQHAVNAAIEDAEQERPGLEEELAGTDTQIRDTTAALDRYLRAFEAGTMPDSVCAPRVEELSSRRQELVDYRDKLAAHLAATTVPTLDRDQLRAVADIIRAVLANGSPAVVKDLLDALIHSVEINAEREAVPYFRVLTPERLTPEPDPARAQGTAVRMGLHQVEVQGIEPWS